MNGILWILQIVLSIKLISVAYTHGLRQDKTSMQEAIQTVGAMARPLLAMALGFGLLLARLIVSASAGQIAVAASASPASVTDVWGGASESIALLSDGTVWTWGWDDYGILGNGFGVPMTDTSGLHDRLYPARVLGVGGSGYLDKIKAIAGGERHNVALDTNGEVWTWGWNYFGQLGIGAYCTGMNTTDCMGTTPIKIPSFTGIKAVASRGYHTLALKTDGTVWAWGYNAWGQLGDGTNQDRHSPVQVQGLDGHGSVSQISGGGEISVALMADKTLMAWGRNYKGEMGNGTIGISDTGQWMPVTVSQTTGLTEVIAIATGWSHVVALAADHTVWTWGDNSVGQLGNGTRFSSSVPERVNGLSEVTGVSAGDGSSAVVKSDGTVWAWGANERGELGDGTTIDRYLPVQVGVDIEFGNVNLVRARDWHNLAIKEDGTVWAWGWNLKGQCGDGTVGGFKTAPVQVIFETNWLFLPAIGR